MVVWINTRKEFEAPDTENVDVSKITQKQMAMIPILEKFDRDFVETLPKIMNKMVNAFFKSCIAASIAKVKNTPIVALTPDEFENMVNDKIVQGAINSIVFEEPKNVIENLTKRFFAQKISNGKNGNNDYTIKMVPWVPGGLTVLGFDNDQKKTIATWVKGRIVQKFAATSRRDKDKLLNYKVLETYHDGKILRNIEGVNHVDDILLEEQDDDVNV